MRILHCISQMPEKTGSGVYFKNLLMYMEKRGYENAALFAFQEPFFVNFPKEIMTFPVKFMDGDLDFYIAGMSDVMPYPSTKYSSMTSDMKQRWKKAFRDKLLEAKEKFKPDVIITHHLFMLTNLAREVFEDEKIISFCHGTDIRQIGRHFHLFREDIDKIQYIDRFFTVSSRDVQNIKKFFSADEKKIEVIGAGFDENIFYQGEKNPKKESIDIAYAGKISREKGIFELIEAMKKVCKKNDQAVFHIIGNIHKEEKKIINSLTKDIKNIRFTGALCQEDFANYLRNMDIFVLASYFESLGLVSLEALACGNYVVSTKIQGLFSLLGDEINSSEVIRYVNLPRLKDIDVPYGEDIKYFVDSLYENIEIQIEKVKKGEVFDRKIKQEIKKLSWEKIFLRIEKYCLE